MASNTTTTDYLELTQILEGATNWGSPLNNNWEKIDREFASLKSNINALQGKAYQYGLVAIDQSTPWIKITGGTIYLGSSQNSCNTRLSGWNDLSSYTGYYIAQETSAQKVDNITIPAFKVGDILLKTMLVTNGSVSTSIVRYPQALGGYYQPTTTITPASGSTSGKLKIEYTPKTGPYPLTYVEEEVELLPKISATVIQKKFSELGSSGNLYTLSLNAYTEHTQLANVDATFFELVNGQWTEVEIGYALQWGSGHWNLVIEPDVPVVAENICVFVKQYTIPTS